MPTASSGGVSSLLVAARARLDVRRFFQVTGVLLIVFATGLMAHGIHKFQETGLLPNPVEHVWDINYLPAVSFRINS